MKALQHRSTALIVTGAVFVAAAAGWSINAWVFDAHSNQVGTSLIHQARAQALRASHSKGACVANPASGPAGVLVAPSVGLVAPVEDGLSDAVLAVAVGHDPSSVWPGSRGTAVLSAHDVSYFVNTDRLSPGAKVLYETPCSTYDFSVTGHQVVHEGSPVYNTPEPSVVLVTCWPTNALWFTPDRLLVTAVETGSTRTTSAKHAHLAKASAIPYAPPMVNAPVGLANEGLTLATNSIPMGTMTIVGSPDPSWVQSPGPLDVESSAIEAYIGGLKALVNDRLSWWHAIAPGVSPPSALVSAGAVGYQSPLNVAITIAGAIAKSVLVTSDVTLAGGPAPGAYALSVLAVLHNGSLSVAKWSLTSR